MSFNNFGNIRGQAVTDARGHNAHREINADGTPRNIITHENLQEEPPVKEWTYDRRWMGRDAGSASPAVLNARERMRQGSGEIIFHDKVPVGMSNGGAAPAQSPAAQQSTPQRPHLMTSPDSPLGGPKRGTLTSQKMLEQHSNEGQYTPNIRGDPNAVGRVKNSMGSGNIITGDLNDTSTPRRLLKEGDRPMDHKFILDHDIAASNPAPFTRRLSSRGLFNPNDHSDLLDHDKPTAGHYSSDHALGPKPQLNYKHRPNDTRGMLDHE